MKRSIALALTIIIFAAIAVCFLRPDDPNPDFGYADGAYALPDIFSVNAFGDTNIMTLECVEARGACILVNFKPVRGTEVLLGSVIYAGGTTTPVEKHFYGHIEKFDDSKWHFYDRLYTREARNLFSENKLKVIPKSYSQAFLFPFHDPGRYRVNFYFREYIREEDCTGDDLYTISFEIEVPPISTRHFDVCSLGANMGEYGVEALSFILRANKGKTPYLDLGSVQIEQSSSGATVPIVGGYTRGSDILYFFEKLIDSTDAPTVSEYLLIFAEPVPAGEYAVSATFTENKDGSGEQYTLTLNLRFGE